MSGNLGSFPHCGRTDRLADPGHLAVRHVWEYRERQDLGRRLLGGRQPSGRETPVRCLPMARDRVVDTGLDPHRGEPQLHLLTSRYPYHREVVHAPGTGQLVDHPGRAASELNPVLGGGAPARLRPGVQPGELGGQHHRLERVEPAVCADNARAGNASPPPGHGRAGT